MSDKSDNNFLNKTLPTPGGPWLWRQKPGDRTPPHLVLSWGDYGVTAAFSSRLGGCSTGPYSGLNLGLHVGDSAADVLENRSRFLAALSCTPRQCVAGEQVHGVKIATVEENQGGAGMLDLASVLPGYDALATQSRVGLMAFFADCVPLFFFDPKTRWAALAHAGWRGSAAGMARAMVAFLWARGCHASDLLAAIGPCVGSCCYEIDEATAAAFKKQIPGFGQYAFRRDNGKYALDLSEVNRLELLRAGLPDSRIFCASLCTCCHSDWFFSYRRQNQTGRMAAFMRIET
ncbi:MAG: peptidoglycan editing factor PgeF [Peptococcaceae bacterium]|nr:peptidoglycan editing factor PgeF [Peptococcaceae bacterium]